MNLKSNLSIALHTIQEGRLRFRVHGCLVILHPFVRIVLEVGSTAFVLCTGSFATVVTLFPAHFVSTRRGTVLFILLPLRNPPIRLLLAIRLSLVG